jgi:hypothetical protein
MAPTTEAISLILPHSTSIDMGITARCGEDDEEEDETKEL